MWLKLLLLSLYFFLLFLLSRVLEVTSWYQETGTLLSSISAIDPLKLSVTKLKELLDTRGISYSGVVEKPELISLVEASGRPTEEEVNDETMNLENSTAKITKFTCGSHFYEEVEDTKDSVWLVQVIVKESNSSFKKSTAYPEEIWHDIVAKVSNFGVRTGVFHCSLDRRLCARKGWASSRLILALPLGIKAKEDVVLHSFLHQSSSHTVLEWVRKKLASSVKMISSPDELNRDWFESSSGSKNPEIKLIFFSVLKSCPMFFSALAFKFSGRVKFGMVQIPVSNNLFSEQLKNKELPIYLVLTPEKRFYYGLRCGENYNFKSVELFLKSLRPEMNDIFLLSFCIINIIVSFELFLLCEILMWKYFLQWIVQVVKYNCSLFFVWLLILALYKFSFMATCTDFLLKCLRYVSSTDVAAVIRDDWKNHYSYPFIIITFISFASISGFLLRKFNVITHNEDSYFSSWCIVPWDSSFMTYFFRPMTTLTQPTASQDMDLEVGMELLIERLAVPNFWLQPVISMDYIRDLPFWKYQGWCEADDAMEENKLDVCSSSEDESAMIQTFNENLALNTQLLDNQYVNTHSSTAQSSETSQCEASESKVKATEVPDYATAALRPSSNICTSTIEDKTKSLMPDADRAPRGMLEFRECSICLENYKYGDVLCGLPCGHNFHMNCIMLWLYRDNHCCPICRWPSYKPKHCMPRSHLQ